MMGWSPQCYIPSFVEIGLPDLEKIFECFYHIWTRRPSWSCDPDLAIKLWFPLPMDAPHKISLLLPSIVQIIFSFWSFEISGCILRNQKIIIGLDSFSNQHLIYIWPHFDFNNLCIDYRAERCEITVILFGSMLSNL